MNYLSNLTDDEAQYICAAIPHNHTIAYFQRHPKEFAKICPGFRASSIARLNVGGLLFRHRNRRFVSYFVEQHISDWLLEIQEHIDNCMEDGDSRDLAYIHTLPQSFFADNVALYFKLIGEKHPEAYISLLDSSVKEIKAFIEEQDQLKTSLNAKQSNIDRLQLELDETLSTLNTSESKLNNRMNEIKTLKCEIVELERLKVDIQDREDTISAQQSKLQALEESTQALLAELSEAKNSCHQLEDQIKAEMEKKRAAEDAKLENAQKPLCPKDINEFKDYLGYNLENIGVSTTEEYYMLLKEHLSHILFQGIPVIINRGVGMRLIRCVANALIGTTNVETFVYNCDVTSQAIDEFLSKSGRIVCLDNFIGNYNETELLPLFEKHRNKVIFLTLAYDRALCFVPEELFIYCHYLNLNRIQSLLVNTELTEDPAIVDEIEIVVEKANSNSRYSLLLREILGELGFRQSLVEFKCAYISDEKDLCRTLAFDILPYCIEVLRFVPYNTSERLVKYAGDTGRCSYKKLFKRWFA